MDRPKFYTWVLSKNKDELQEELLKIGRAAFLISRDYARTNENGELLPSNKQTDEQIKVIFKAVGL